MAVNDEFMLPKRVRRMKPMDDLLQAEQIELTQTQRVIAALESQLTISISTFLLPRHERLFALPTDTSESLEDRRNKVLAKLNTRSPTTVRAVQELVKIMTGFEVKVAEYYSLYTFELIFQNIDRPIDYTALDDALEVMKPAHLLHRYAINIKPLESSLWFGGFFAAIVRFPVPEAESDMRFEETLRSGGAMAVQALMPVPEL